jgi:hypothetical protein
MAAVYTPKRKQTRDTGEVDESKYLRSYRPSQDKPTEQG